MCLDSINPSHFELEEHTRFQFPDSATLISYQMSTEDRDSSCTIWISFQIQEEDIDYLFDKFLN